jgi:hypothetical protein
MKDCSERDAEYRYVEDPVVPKVKEDHWINARHYYIPPYV